MFRAANPARIVARLVRSPALHFLAIGGLLFAGSAWWEDLPAGNAAATASEPLVITAAQVEQLRRDLVAENGKPPTPQQLNSAIDAAVDEEILFRQAKAIGLDRDNQAVRQRLIKIARFVADEPDQDEEALYQAALQLGLDRSDMVVRRHLAMMMRLAAANTPLPKEAPPDDEELAAYLRQHPERFMKPWRVRLTHVYLSEDRRGSAAESDARELLGRFRAAGTGPDEALQSGDPFLLGQDLPWQTRQGLERILGSVFADAASGLPPNVWSEPIRSSYGWHLVWVRAIRAEAVATLVEAREVVLRAVLEQRQEQRVEKTLEAMRSLYAIKVELPATVGAAPTRPSKDG